MAFDRHAGTALTVDATPVPLTIDGKQATNILGCKVSGIVHQAGADVDCNTSIEFPNYMTGVFEVVVSVFLSAGGSAYTVGNGIGFRTGSSIASLPPVQTTGSLELFPMYLETESKGVAQNWTRDNHSFAVTGSNQGLQDTMCLDQLSKLLPSSMAVVVFLILLLRLIISIITEHLLLVTFISILLLLLNLISL